MLTLKELFDVHVGVPMEVEGHIITFYFRNATSDEELQYSRRTSKRKINDGGNIESPDSVLTAPRWLFDKLLTKVTLQNGTGEQREVAKEELQAVPENVKIDALAAFRARVKRTEKDTVQD